MIKKALEKELQYTPSSALEFDTVAKCYLYLGDKENSIGYFLEAIKDVERLVEVFSNEEVIPWFLSDDQSLIKKSLEEIIKDIKDERIQPFHNPLNIQDPWEWY